MPAPRPLRSLADRTRGLRAYFSRRELVIGGAIVLVVLGVIVWGVASEIGGDEDSGGGSLVAAPAGGDDEGDSAPLGFPILASRNTTRIAGADPIADAAAVALATHPPSSGADPVEAVVMVGERWQSGLAASVLSSPDVLGAPILIGTSDGVPAATAEALEQLDPRSGGGPADAQVFRADDVNVPSGLQATDIEGKGPAEIANAIDELRQRVAGSDPRHVVIVSEDDPGTAMPAAAWAARSGDPVLFVGRDSVPEATAEALKRHRGVAVYALGPESAISEKALREVRRSSPNVTRIGEPDPVANAVAFARYSDGTFGWNINDPGHGLVVANANRPTDAGAVAGLSASGKWGPLLLTDDARRLPDVLRQFLLDIKPGYKEDPTRALYNHVWVIGDANTIGAEMQAEIDELSELVRIGGGGAAGGGPSVSAGPSIDEEIPQAQLDKAKKKKP